MILSEQEVRVLGCLIEKSQATPEYYPMTVNGLVAACNQKTSRDPVVEYGSEEVEDALHQLIEKGLCASVSGSGRAIKYKHRCGDSGLQLSNAQIAALSILMLRGAQTIGEIKGRSSRQYEFSSLEEAQGTLDSLMVEEQKYVEQASRRPGQKEVRFRHLFFAYRDDGEETHEAAAAPSLRNEVEALNQKIEALQKENTQLQHRVVQLEEVVNKLKEDLY